MSIPFTQYLLPDGRMRSVDVERPPEIEALAEGYIARGGWFECEVLTNGDVSLTACWDREDGDNDVEIEIASNGKEVLEAVDRLVRRATLREDL